MLSVLPLVLATLASGDVRAHRPPGAPSWWAGLDAPTETAPARGVQYVRLPPSGRVRIPGGRYVMGSTPTEMMRAVALCKREVFRSRCDDIATAFRAEGVAHEVTLSPFLIDRTEVTVADYARCVAAGACSAPGYLPGDARFDRPALPVTSVRWEEAGAYCRWAKGRLPTEAEWEYAARGTASREFPWGMNYNPHVCNHGAFANDDTDKTDGFVGLAPVGSFPDGATPLGVVDLAGNAGEWVEDVYDIDENGFGYAPKPQTDPHGPKNGGFHVVRGGSYSDGAPWMRAAARGVTSLARAPFVGFRCAADAAP